MLASAQRLSRNEFGRLSRAKRFKSEHISLIFGPAERGGCAVVVPKKVAKRAVDRHLLKRRIAALLQPYCRPGYALVVHAKAGSLELSYPALKAELAPLFRSLPV